MRQTVAQRRGGVKPAGYPYPGILFGVFFDFQAVGLYPCGIEFLRTKGSVTYER
jgi:hypothetical protein